ncbi:MAG: hypothetical protein MJB12_04030 [Firmicutes bacterium]|nr:hypothetical protein [Bacillota bacterium]
MYHTNRVNHTKKVILPLKDHILRTWPGINFLFSIIQNKENAYDWIMNSYVQIYGVLNDNIDRVGRIDYYPYCMHNFPFSIYDLCPFIVKYALPTDIIIDQYHTFTNFLMDALDKGLYVSSLLDQFFRPEREGEQGVFHASYIYGYDMEKQLIYAADHFYHQKYSFMKIDFDKMNEAYRLLDNPPRLNGFRTYLYALKDAAFKFDLKLLVDLFKDYLHAKNPFGSFNRFTKITKNQLNEYYGLNCYDMLQTYLHRIIDIYHGKGKDCRFFVSLVDHKTLMKLRIDYLIRKGYLSNAASLVNEIKALEVGCKITLSLFLKYMITDDISLVDKISKKLENFKSRDQRMTEVLIEKLEQGKSF